MGAGRPRQRWRWCRKGCINDGGVKRKFPAENTTAAAGAGAGNGRAAMCRKKPPAIAGAPNAACPPSPLHSLGGRHFPAPPHKHAAASPCAPGGRSGLLACARIIPKARARPGPPAAPRRAGGTERRPVRGATRARCRFRSC
jgi:hypothetical protein